MDNNNVLDYIKDLLQNVPSNWLNLTTHRLDIYNENLAKRQFLTEFEELYSARNSDLAALNNLPTAYDYIRLGHPLSCILEWAVAKLNKINPESVISFSSKTIPILAILRKNLLSNKNTQITYTGEMPDAFNEKVLREVYGYRFDLTKVEKPEDISWFEGTTIFISNESEIEYVNLIQNIDVYINFHNNRGLGFSQLGSILSVNTKSTSSNSEENYISDIQYVRRRETIAMTPANCFTALQMLVKNYSFKHHKYDMEANLKTVSGLIKNITGTNTKSLYGSSGLSIQYAIMMGLIDDALERHAGKAIKFIVPPNCYGGTNDQARRVAECIPNVEVVDLPVDGNNDMVESINRVLAQIANEDAVPYIIAEIPTNPRIEVPDLEKLRDVLSISRKTQNGEKAVDPVFILDQTFCPNVQFLSEGNILSTIRSISYASGSKFPSGGQCTAGYCLGNNGSKDLMNKIDLHLKLCDNEATDLQMEILAKQLPSMNQRIDAAYKNTRDFVNFIQEALPEAEINFVTDELAQQGFTPSVFSLDLPTTGSTNEERESHKRKLNLKLINMMISEIPEESKFCVSYGQLKGCYWTIPATSTQGTTKEDDKDYIVRASLSPDMNLALHKKVFMDFVRSI